MIQKQQGALPPRFGGTRRGKGGGSRKYSASLRQIRRRDVSTATEAEARQVQRESRADESKLFPRVAPNACAADGICTWKQRPRVRGSERTGEVQAEKAAEEAIQEKRYNFLSLLVPPPLSLRLDVRCSLQSEQGSRRSARLRLDPARGSASARRQPCGAFGSSTHTETATALTPRNVAAPCGHNPQRRVSTPKLPLLLLFLTSTNSLQHPRAQGTCCVMKLQVDFNRANEVRFKGRCSLSGEETRMTRVTEQLVSPFICVIVDL